MWERESSYRKAEHIAIARRTGATGSMIAAATITCAGGAVYLGGELRWEDQIDRAGTIDKAQAVFVDERRVFVAGNLRDDATTKTDFYVAAYDAITGKPLWDDQFDYTGLWDRATEIVAQGDQVFVAGRANAEFAVNDLIVRAYDAATGALLWDDQYDHAGGSDEAAGIALLSDRVYVVANVEDEAGDLVIIVRSYHRDTGVLAWMSEFPGATARAMTVRHGGVFISGQVEVTNVDTDFLVLAYRANNGQLEWSDQVISPGIFEAAMDVAADDHRVVAVGRLESGTFDYVVRGYDALTGALEFFEQLDVSGGDDEAASVAISDGRVFVAGYTTPPAYDPDFLVRGYDLLTGALLWSERYDGGGSIGWDFTTVVSVDRHRAVVGGWSMNPTGLFDWMVRAHEVQTGDVAWEDRYNAGGDDQVRDLAVSHHRAFAVGRAGNDFVIRVYRSEGP